MERRMRFNVDVPTSYVVESDGPDLALRTVLPLVASANNVRFDVREVTEKPAVQVDVHRDRYAHLTQSVYKVDEVANILGISRGGVSEKVPCIRVGRRRLYPRATIIDVLENGLAREEPVIQQAYRSRETAPKRPKVSQAVTASQGAKLPTTPKLCSVKEAARMLCISYAKAKELFNTCKIYSTECNGKRTVPSGAVEHFLAGGTPAQFVEVLIECAKGTGIFRADTAELKEAANELRRLWVD